MKEYIITIAAAAAAASLVDILAPKQWEKYIRIIIGFLILSVIIAPVAKLKDAEILPPTASYNISDTPLKDKVSEQLRQNIESDIEERVREEFDTDVKAIVEIDVDENHSIKGVRAIKITASANPAGMIDRLKNIYGCDRIELCYE